MGFSDRAGQLKRGGRFVFCWIVAGVPNASVPKASVYLKALERPSSADRIDHRDWDHFTALARTLISPAEWDAAYAEGLAMSEAETVAYALAADDDG